MSNNGKTKIAVVEEKVSKIERWVDNADLNHFPTIEKRFDKIENKLAYYTGALAVLSIAIGLFVKYYG